MEATGDINPLVLPPALLAELEAAAGEEHRSVADMLLDLVERALNERRWKAQAETEWQRARELGIHDAADELPITDEYRQTIREKIARGLQSMREGKGTDGEAFFAEMYAELDALERHGH